MSASHRVKLDPAPRPGRRPIREDLVRAACLEAYGAIRHDGWLADRALESVLRRRRPLWASERRAVAERVYALVRRQALVEHALDRGIGAAFGRVPRTTADALRFAALAVLDGADPEATRRAFGFSAELAAGLSAAARIDTLLAALPADERVALRASVPAWIARAVSAEVGEAELEAALAALNARAPLCARANALKTDRGRLAAALAAEGVSSRPTRFAQDGLILDDRRNAFSLPAFKAGWFEIQDEGSQIVAEMVGARPGERVVDACAGAGGKTLALAAAMANRGEVVAIDVDVVRLEAMRRRARRAGAHNVRTRVVAADDRADAELADLRGRADRVLVDVPCSGLGALRRNPDARWRIAPDDVERHAARQIGLLERFAPLARPGGLVVYATCSLLARENEALVAEFRRRHPTYAVVPVPQLLGGARADALSAGDALRLWPHRHGTDGFYAVGIRPAPAGSPAMK